MVAMAMAMALAPCPRAWAQSTSATLAETLFQEGRRLMNEKNYAEACPKLAESQRLDPATGTLLNLAVCHQDQGKLASAWVEFSAALSSARLDHRPDREQLARDHIAAIEPRVAHVTLGVPDAARVPGLEVNLDGTTVGAAAWGISTPMDPGTHALTATAPGRRAWSSRFEGPVGASRQPVQIPVLVAESPARAAPPAVVTAPAPGPPPLVSAPANETAPSPAPASPASGSGVRTAAYAVGGAGVAALGVGTYFGLRAFSKWSDRNKNCPNEHCSPDGNNDYEAARTASLVANVAFGVGIAAVATGAFLWLRSRSPEPDGAASAAAGFSSVSLAPSVGFEGGGLLLGGRW